MNRKILHSSFIQSQEHTTFYNISAECNRGKDVIRKDNVAHSTQQDPKRPLKPIVMLPMMGRAEQHPTTASVVQ